MPIPTIAQLDALALSDPINRALMISYLKGMQAELPAPYTWAAKPTAAALGARNKIHVTDVGGPAGSIWVSDGTIYHPQNGRALLYAKSGSWDGSLASIGPNGTPGTLYAIPGGQLALPPGLLQPGFVLGAEIETWHSAGTGNGTSLTVWFGTTASSSDPKVASFGAGAVNTNKSANLRLSVVSKNKIANCYSLDWNATAAASSSTTNVNTDAQMTLSIGSDVFNATNDVQQLIRVNVWVEG